MRLLSILLLMACCAVGLPVAAEADDYPVRKWTNDKGETIDAKLLRVSGSTAILDQDGNIVRAPISRLSDADKEWIKDVRELNRWREWTMIDGSTRRAKLSEIEGDEITLSDRDLNEQVELTLEGLSDADRELLATVYGTDSPTAGSPAIGGLSNRPTGGVSRGRGLESGVIPGSGEIRSWTDVRGKTIEAEYRGLEGDKIVLFFQNREWRVPILDFSTEDQIWVSEHVLDQVAKQSQPTAPAAPQVASAGGNNFNNTQDAIRGRMNPGLGNSNMGNSNMGSSHFGGSNAGGSHSNSGMGQPQNDALASARENQRRLEQASLERERRLNERLASAPTASPSHTNDNDIGFQPPGFNAPQSSSPTYPTSANVPEEQMVQTMTCGSCNHTWVVSNFKAGGKCPGCGITIDTVEDGSGNVVDETGSSKARRYVGLVRLAVIALMVGGGLLAKMAR